MKRSGSIQIGDSVFTLTEAGSPTACNFSLSAYGANLFNRQNLGLPNGTLSSPSFGKSQSLAGGFFGPGYYDDYWDYPDYAYNDYYYDNGGCYIVHRRVHTPYGWRIRPVEVCG